MKLIKSPFSRVFQNLAAEEYILKNFSDDFYFQYSNQKAVVIGKHQNALNEINYRYTDQKNIQIARRLSGGGAVYHDSGNLNFCMILQGEPGKLIDFRKYATPILLYVQELGLEAYFCPRNNMFVQGKKFSGNAEHLFKSRVLHHGTLLIDTDLEALEQSISPPPKVYADKAIRSVRDTVCNLRPLLPVDKTPQEFADGLFESMKKQYQGQVYTFTDSDIEAINELAEQKYSQWEWTFGYSPAYTFTKKSPFLGAFLEVSLSVKKGGSIERCTLKSDALPYSTMSIIETLILGQRHQPETFIFVHQDLRLPVNQSEFVNAFF